MQGLGQRLQKLPDFMFKLLIFPVFLMMRLSQNVTIFYILYTCKENVELKKNVYMKQKLTCITHMTFDIRRFEAAPFYLETKHIRTIDNKLLINNFNFRWDICRYQYVFKYVLIKIFSPVFKFHNI